MSFKFIELRNLSEVASLRGDFLNIYSINRPLKSDSPLFLLIYPDKIRLMSVVPERKHSCIKIHSHLDHNYVISPSSFEQRAIYGLCIAKEFMRHPKIIFFIPSNNKMLLLEINFQIYLSIN